MRSLFHDNYLIIQLTPASALACVSPPIDPLLPEMPARNVNCKSGEAKYPTSNSPMGRRILFILLTATPNNKRLLTKYRTAKANKTSFSKSYALKLYLFQE